MPTQNYTDTDRDEIIQQFQDPSGAVRESRDKFKDLVPDWSRTDEAYGTRASTQQTEIPEVADTLPFVNYRSHSIIPTPIPGNKGYPYYRNLVKKFGAPLPKKATEDRRQELHIPINPSADPSARPKLNTSWEYTGNYFEILTHLIPDKYTDINSPQHDPDFHYVNMDDEVFKRTKIEGKYGYNAH